MIRILSLFAFVLITGCVSQIEHTPSAWLKPGVKIELPSPGLDVPMSEQQLLTAKVKGKSHSLIALLDVNQERISLAGLSSLGVRLFLVTYDACGIRTEQPITLPELPPAEQVLSDIMLSYWPIARWETQLPQGWTLVDKDLVRELRDEQQQLVSQIHYQNIDGQRAPVQIDNQIFSYQITIGHLGAVQ